MPPRKPREQSQLTFPSDSMADDERLVAYTDGGARGNPGPAALGELLLFTAILVAGLAWVWAHGDLEWVKNLGAASYEAPPAGSKSEPRKAA